jgi:hypothetical protein
MAKQNSSDPPENRTGYWRRVLRPLSWWLLLVLVLYGIRTHQRLMEQTRLEFTVTLQGQPHYEASTTFDGKPAISGQNIPLGNHSFAVTYPKGEPYSTNWFIWYGEHDLGTIDLKRTMGTLSVSADPPAPYLYISGPEWSVTLTNSSGLTQSVPTDEYTVESRYAHWNQSYDIVVYENTATPLRIAPRLGAVQLSCNQPDATFQLLTLDNQQEEAGGFPDLITELPEGNYKLISKHHRHQHEQTLAVTAGTTNDNPVEFLYGTAVLETEPPDASVQDGYGREWGITPLTLSELTPGTLQVTIHRMGYEPVPVSLEITADQTTTFQTNLISTSYTGGMNAARQFMASSDYDRALQAIGDALIAKPDDSDALALQREAIGLGHLKSAKELGQQGDYIGGDRELTLALQSLPDNGEVKQLLADYKQREPEQIEHRRVERLNLPQKSFDELCDNYPDSKLFDEHEIKTSKAADEVADGITKALRSEQPPFVMEFDQLTPTPEIHLVIGTQKFTTGFLSFAERTCLIIVGQTKDDESQIIFKVLEYQRHHKFDINAPLSQLSMDEELIPVSPTRIPNMTDKLKAQIQAGVSNVTACVQVAIGQTPAVQPAVSQ